MKKWRIPRKLKKGIKKMYFSNSKKVSSYEWISVTTYLYFSKFTVKSYWKDEIIREHPVLNKEFHMQMLRHSMRIKGRYLEFQIQT